MQGRRRAVQADHDLGRAGGDRLNRLGKYGQIGGQRAHARHRATRACCTLAVMMVRGGSALLRGGLVVGIGSGVIMRGLVVRSAVMRVAGRHLVLHRHEVGEEHVVKAWRWTSAKGQCCGRRENAEQIG